MTPALLAALRPHLSLVNFGTIEPKRATRPVLLALQTAGIGQPALRELGTVVLVEADVALASGARFTRRAALLLTPGRDGQAFRVLDWDHAIF
jgi:hypothetical protein